MARARDITPKQLIEQLDELHKLLPELRGRMVDELVARYGRGDPQVLAAAEIIKTGVSPLTPQIPSSLDMPIEQWTSGVPVTAITGSVQAQVPTAEQAYHNSLWLDVQLFRTLVAEAHLKLLRTADGKPLPNAGAKLYVFAVAYQLNVDGRLGNKIPIDAVIARMKAAGVAATEHTIRTRWIGHVGNPFWRRAGDFLYLTGYNRLCKLAVELAVAAGRADLVEDDMPGTRFIEVPAARSLKEWCAFLLAAWHNHRKNTVGNARISRAKLQALWGVTRRILLQWEQTAGIKTERAYRIINDEEHIPAHAYPTIFIEEGVPTVKPMARQSNRYNVSPKQQRQHKRTPRTGRWYARRALESHQPGDDRSKRLVVGSASAPQQDAHTALSSQGRLNFYAQQDTPAAVVKAFKRVQRHLRKCGDYQTAHYVCLGRNRWGTALYEQTSDGLQHTVTHHKNGVIVATNRAPRHLEDAYFASHGGRGSWTALYREYAK